jgi:hypothetical protein
MMCVCLPSHGHVTIHLVPASSVCIFITIQLDMVKDSIIDQPKL